MKLTKWIKDRLPSKRRIIQLYAALLFNANLKGFGKGRIYQGKAKYACTPGLNCYSCPGASGSCPLGAMQNALSASGTCVPYYMLGIILLYGLLFARWICGFLCPFGLVQDLLHKIKTPKLKKNRFTRALSYLKYVILVVFVVIFPLMYMLKDMPLPGFCKYICPAGTLGGALGLLSHSDNAEMFGMLGPLFTWKFLLLVIFVVGAIFIYRFFCRFFCPLGALYGLFNKISFVGVDLNRSKCTDCGLCVGHCKMDIRHVGDHECISCGECIGVCPTNAITMKGGKVFLAPDAITPNDTPVEKAEKKRRQKRSIAARWIAGILMASLLGGALYYYNVVDKIPEVSATPDVEEDVNIDGVVISSGNKVGTLCYTMNLPLVKTDGVVNPRDYRGKITIINFWGTWCGPCKAELPDFDRIASEYAEDVKIIAIHSDYAKNTALDYVNETFPNSNMIFAIDEGDAYYNLLGGDTSYPITWVLNEEGVIIAKYVGTVHYDELKGHIEAEKQN